jgi:hypothetical protein
MNVNNVQEAKGPDPKVRPWNRAVEHGYLVEI